MIQVRDVDTKNIFIATRITDTKLERFFTF
jgi:hypothetical protein